MDWRKAMTIWSAAVAGFGVVLLGMAVPATDGPSRLLFRLMGGAAVVPDGPLRFATALMGAVTFGWGLSILAVASASKLLDHAAERLVWRRLGAAVAAWYLADSAASIATGFALNAASNTAFVLWFAAILWRGGVIGARQA